MVYVRTVRHGNSNGRIFWNFLFQRAKLFEKSGTVSGKGNENSGNRAKDSQQHTRCLLFLLTKQYAATIHLIYTYPGVQNTKDLADQSNKLEILLLIRFIYHKMYFPSSGL